MLDLLAGWMKYVAECEKNFSEENHPKVSKEQYTFEVDEISNLYQEAGQMKESSSDEELIKFINEKIVPLIIGKT